MKTINKSQNGFTVVEILIVVAVIGLVGFLGWRFLDSQQQNNKPTSQLNSQAVLPESLAGIKSIDEIIALATTEIAERQVLAVELEQEDEALVYSMKLSDGTMLIFDARTGDKVQLKSTDSVETDDDMPLPAGFKPAITFDVAIQTAKAERPGKVVQKVELEQEDGIVVYSVRFSDDGRVDVDATTGSVLRIREPGKPDVKLQDNDNDIDDDGQQNGQDIDDDNDNIKDTDDSDNENDGVVNITDEDDDNDGTDDSSDDDSDNSGSGRE
jgi:prepilin-type N-terminal cleavage/methylation domain-containing protein